MEDAAEHDYVGRPTIWGNPFTGPDAVSKYRAALLEYPTSGEMLQSPRGTLHEVAKARVNGDVTAATLISLEALYGEGGIMTTAAGEDDAIELAGAL